MNRRRFLKYAGATAAVVGVSAFGFLNLSAPKSKPLNQSATAIVSDTTPPAITDLKWTPTRAQNSKVYDGQVTFEASDTQSGLSNASLDWESVYPSQISKAAIPLEDTKRFSLGGTIASSSRNVSFGQGINDLTGGKEYSANITAKDLAGNEATQNLTIPYVREFEVFTPNASVLVSANYLFEFTRGERPDYVWSNPLLGAYYSDDLDAIVRHNVMGGLLGWMLPARCLRGQNKHSRLVNILMQLALLLRRFSGRLRRLFPKPQQLAQALGQRWRCLNHPYLQLVST